MIDNNFKYKFLTPLYVPVVFLEKYMKMNDSELEINLLKQVHFNKTGNYFIFVDSESQNVNEFPQKFIGQNLLNHNPKNNMRIQERDSRKSTIEN